jgi:hypothetical protein
MRYAPLVADVRSSVTNCSAPAGEIAPLKVLGAAGKAAMPETVPMLSMLRWHVFEHPSVRAIEQSREFDVDEAEFQNELVTIANTYQERLGELCGTFTGSDGRVYPAIPRFAHLSDELAGLDDPCGATKAGAIWLKGADIETRALELQESRVTSGSLGGFMA